MAAGWLVDTNVISELYLSVLTLGEIRKGVEALADSGRRTVLRQWLEWELPVFFCRTAAEAKSALAGASPILHT